ncbi:MAG: sulfatase [Gemmatimonadetes bacterium]|nr:sulfatase [Gemmatimonadota bacterium]
MKLVRLLRTLVLVLAVAEAAQAQSTRPNILFVITDDQSYPHASAYGSRFVQTPSLDRVAREGVLFTNAFVASPGCSPSRAAFLTGRYPWQIEHAGTHASSFSTKYVVFPDLLEQSGYWVGFPGTGWGPGDWRASGRTRNPAGPEFNTERLQTAVAGISAVDYAANFREFLRRRPTGAPFYFWFGASEPHRTYEEGAGIRAGKRLEDVEVPGYLPDTREVRSDLLDYAREIESADRHLGSMLRMLEAAGELDNTLIIVTSDNGMPFPRAKGTVYDAGIHVPMAVRWGGRVPGGRVVEDLVSLVDFTPTVLEVAGVSHRGTYPMSGRSLVGVLTSTASGIVDPSRDAVFTGRERHSSSRWNNLGYPQRAIRTGRYLYIRNFAPERWPAGAPRKYEENGTLGPMHGSYHDIDEGPTLALLTSRAGDPFFHSYLHLAVGVKPAEELYDVRNDPACLHNLAADRAHANVTREHRERLAAFLAGTGDPRVLGNGDIWESYERLSGPARKFPVPEWALPVTAPRGSAEAPDKPRGRSSP